nr:MAG TPA: hypothetical protein [Caudoviricetes sp.]
MLNISHTLQLQSVKAIVINLTGNIYLYKLQYISLSPIYSTLVI